MEHIRHQQFAGLVIGLLIGLILSEVALRLWVVFSPQDSQARYVKFMRQNSYEYDRELGNLPYIRKTKDTDLLWELIPNTQNGHLHINASGFRGSEYSTMPGPGVTRVAVL